VAVAVAATAAFASLAGPLAYTLDTIGTSHTGALPTAGPAVTSAFGGPGGGGFGGAGTGVPGSTGRSGTGRSGTGRPGTGFAPPGSGTGSSGSGSGVPGGGTFGRPAGGSARGAPTGSRPGGSGQAGFGGGGAPGGAGGLGGSTTVSSALARLLEEDASRYTWAAATVSSDSAAPLQLATGDPIMSIGGFNGTDPAPALAQFERYVEEHKIHYFVGTNADSFGGGSGDAAAITKWVASHFRSQTVGGEKVYNLTQPVSG
jgi:hypothetical protein